MIPGPIDGVAAGLGLSKALAPKPAAKPDGGFAEVVSGVIRAANTAQSEAETQAQAVAAGKGDIVESMLALSRADLSLRFVVSLRNRALDSYNEIMRLQL